MMRWPVDAVRQKRQVPRLEQSPSSGGATRIGGIAIKAPVDFVPGSTLDIVQHKRQVPRTAGLAQLQKRSRLALAEYQPPAPEDALPKSTGMVERVSPQTQGRPWLDALETRGLQALRGSRAELGTKEDLARSFLLTRTASGDPQTSSVYSNRSKELEQSGQDAASRALASQTQENHATALRWWARFAKHVGLRVELLQFDQTKGSSVAHVTGLVIQFLQFTHRMMRQIDGPPTAQSAVQYWRVVKAVHKERIIDLDFTDFVVKRWEKGTERTLLELLGPRLKKRKCAFSHAQIRDMYGLSWDKYGGIIRPNLRVLVFRAAGKLGIQAMFRASEYAAKSGSCTFNPNLGLTRHMLEFYADTRQNVRVEPTFIELTRMLELRKGSALVRIPQLKNDQMRTKDWPPVVLTFHAGEICPLVDLILMELEAPMESEAIRMVTPLFVDPDTAKQITKPRLASIFVDLIKRSCYRLTRRYYSDKEIRRIWSLHSFRITGQNFLRANGAKPWEIKLAGRWSSDCFETYTREDLARLGRLGENLRSDTAPLVDLPGLTTVHFPYETRVLTPSLPIPASAGALEGPGEYMLPLEQQNPESWMTPENEARKGNIRKEFTVRLKEGAHASCLVGRFVQRNFGGTWHHGKVVKVDEAFARVNYRDGDFEDLDLEELPTYLVSE